MKLIPPDEIRWLFIIIGNYVITPLPNTRQFCMVLYDLGVLGIENRLLHYPFGFQIEWSGWSFNFVFIFWPAGFVLSLNKT